MSYQQLVNPNLDPYIYQPDGNGGAYILPDWLGWCAAYVQSAFGVGWIGLSALDAWNRNSQFNHADENIPDGVFVPIFFDGFGGDGHTAILRVENGMFTMWSSPVTYKPYADVWNADSLQGIKDIIHQRYSWSCNYLGWADSLAGTQLIGLVEPTPVPNPAPAPTPDPVVVPEPVVIPDPTPVVTPDPVVVPDPAPVVIPPVVDPTPVVTPDPVVVPTPVPNPIPAPVVTPPKVIIPNPTYYKLWELIIAIFKKIFGIK